MIWLKMISGARWLPYVLIAAPILVGIVFGWGYLKGFDSAEDSYLKKLNESLARQMSWESKIHAKEMTSAIELERSKNVISYRVRTIPRPVAVCGLGPECLQWYDNILQAPFSD